MRSWPFNPDIESFQHPLCIGQIANDSTQWGGESSRQRWQRDDLSALGEMWLLVKVDHLELVAPFEVVLTDFLDVGDRVD